MNRKMNGIYLGKLAGFIARAVPATLLMAVVLLLLRDLHIGAGGKIAQLAFLAGEIFAGAVVYVAAMIILKAEDALYLVKLFKQRFNM